MIRRNYHYLVSGLPVLSFDERMWTTVAKFREFLAEHLQPEDFEQVRLLLLVKDHENLLAFLQKQEINPENAGSFNLGNFNNPEDNFPGDEGHSLPAYMAEILLAHADSKEEPDIPSVTQALDEGFFSHIMTEGNSFLKQYVTFDYNVRNLLAFVKSGAYKLEQEKYITGDTSHTRHLESYIGRNLPADPEFEHFEEIMSATSARSFAEAEEDIDELKWRVIDEMNLFEYFTLDRVLGYLLKLLILERWEPLDKTTGEASLREMIDAARQQINSETGIIADSR